jgi:hypothetical protein
MNEVDLAGLLTVGTIASLVAAAGFGIDKLLLDRQRNATSELLLRWWSKVEALEPRAFDVAIAKGFLERETAIFGNVFSPRRLVISAAVSIPLTTVVVVLADHFAWYQNLGLAVENLGNRQPLVMYPVNYLFDTLTVVATVLAIRLFIIVPATVRIGVLFLDLFVGVLLGFGCYVLAVGAEFPDHAVLDLRDWTFRPRYLRSELQFYLGYLREFSLIPADLLPQAVASPTTPELDPWLSWRPVYGGDVGSFAFSSTTMIPTVMLNATLLTMGISIATMRALRAASMQLFELDLETDKSVFFYTATALAVLATTGKLCWELWRFL